MLETAVNFWSQKLSTTYLFNLTIAFHMPSALRKFTSYGLCLCNSVPKNRLPKNCEYHVKTLWGSYFDFYWCFPQILGIIHLFMLCPSQVCHFSHVEKCNIKFELNLRWVPKFPFYSQKNWKFLDSKSNDVQTW